MAKRPVVEIKCSRCDRTEYREVPEAPNFQGAETTAFQAHLLGGDGQPLVVKFEDLCSPCEKTVKSHLDQIGKKIEGASPERGKTSKKPKEKVNGHQVLEEMSHKKTDERLKKVTPHSA